MIFSGKRAGVAVSLVFLTRGAAAHATVIYAPQGFESAGGFSTTGGPALSTDPADLWGQGGPYWGPDGVLPPSDAAYGPIYTPGAATNAVAADVEKTITDGGSQAVSLTRLSTSADTRWIPSKFYSAPYQPTAAGTPIIDIDWDMNIASGGSGAVFGIELDNGFGSTAQLAFAGVDSAGNVIDDHSGGVVPSGATVSTDSWHHFQLQANFTTQTYSLYVDDSATPADTFSFQNLGGGAFTAASLLSTSDNGAAASGTAYYDNYVINAVTAGTRVITNTSTFTGTTVVSTGTLDIQGALADSNTITVDSTSAPATLILDGANAVPAAAGIYGIGTFGATITVNAPQTIASINSVGSTTFTAGNSTIGTIDGTGTLSVNGTANITAGHVRQGTLNIGSASTVTIAAEGTSAATSILTNLSNSGTLDLKNNDLIVTNGSNVGGQIAAAYNGGAWNSPGIASTSASSHTGYNLGYATVGIGAGSLNISSFDGQPVSSGTTVAKYTLSGDLNLDNSVDQNDIALLAPHYGTTSGATWYQGDVNHDGAVDQKDIALIAPNYGQSANAPGNALTNALTPSVNAALVRSISPSLSGGISPALNHLYTWDAALPDATAGNVVIKVDNTTGDSHFGDVILQGNSATLYTLVITSASGSMNSGRYDSLNAQYNGGGGSEAATLQGLAVDNTTNHSGNFSVFSQTANKINEAGLGVTLDFTSNAESVDMSVKANNKNLFSGITADLAFSWSGQNGQLVSGLVEYSTPVSTPEPGMLGMLGVGGVMMMRRRRKAR